MAGFEQSQINGSQLLFKISKAKELMNIIWKKNDESTHYLSKDIHNVDKYTLLSAFFNILKDIYVLDKNNTSEIVLEKLLEFFKEYQEEYHNNQNEEIVSEIKKIKKEYDSEDGNKESSIKDIVQGRLVPSIDRVLTHINEFESDEKIGELISIGGNICFHIHIEQLLNFTERVVTLVEKIEQSGAIESKKKRFYDDFISVCRIRILVLYGVFVVISIILCIICGSRAYLAPVVIVLIQIAIHYLLINKKTTKSKRLIKMQSKADILWIIFVAISVLLFYLNDAVYILVATLVVYFSAIIFYILITLDGINEIKNEIKNDRLGFSIRTMFVAVFIGIIFIYLVFADNATALTVIIVGIIISVFKLKRFPILYGKSYEIKNKIADKGKKIEADIHQFGNIIILMTILNQFITPVIRPITPVIRRIFNTPEINVDDNLDRFIGSLFRYFNDTSSFNKIRITMPYQPEIIFYKFYEVEAMIFSTSEIAVQTLGLIVSFVLATLIIVGGSRWFYKKMKDILFEPKKDLLI